MVDVTGSEVLMKGLFFAAAAASLILTLLFVLPLHFGTYSIGMVASFIIGVIYFRRRPTKREMVAVLGCTLLLLVLRSTVFGWSQLLPFDLSDVALFLALACLFMLLLPLPWDTKAGQKSRIADFALALGVPAFAAGIAIPLWLEAGISPHTLDYNLYAFDASLGFHPSFWMGRMLVNHVWLREMCGVAYYGLPLMFVVLATGPVVYRRRPRLLFSMLAAGVIGGILYQVVPAAGPIYAFHGSFPFSPPAAQRFLRAGRVAIPRRIPRNCMPSLHFGWVLLIFLNVRWSRWRNIGAACLLLLTAFATIGFGEHYLIDLIVAVPFILAIQEASERKWFLSAVNGTLSMAWMLGLRFGPGALTGSVLLAWSLVIATLVISVGVHNLELGGRRIANRRPAFEENEMLQPQATTESV